VLESRMLRVLCLAVSWKRTGAAIRAAWMTTTNTQNRFLASSLKARTEISHNLSRQVIYSFRKTYIPLFAVIDAAALNRSWDTLREAPMAPVYVEKGSRTRTPVILAMACSNECVIAVHEGSVNGSELFNSFAGLSTACGTCSLLNNIAFHEYSIEWRGIRLYMQRIVHSGGELPRRSPKS